MNLTDTVEALHQRFIAAGGDQLAFDYAHDLRWELIKAHVRSLSHVKLLHLTCEHKAGRRIHGLHLLALILLSNASDTWI